MYLGKHTQTAAAVVSVLKKLLEQVAWIAHKRRDMGHSSWGLSPLSSFKVNTNECLTTHFVLLIHRGQEDNLEESIVNSYIYIREGMHTGQHKNACIIDYVLICGIWVSSNELEQTKTKKNK